MSDGYYKNGESEEPIFGIRTIGSSKWVDQSTGGDPVRAVQADIRAGAGHIEITAPGTGRGDRNNMTFEGFDTDQREALRELVKINDVNLSVHATPAVQLSGFDRQQNFRDEIRTQAINEIKKAIDFSADVSSGGSVVVHTGEFPRAMYTDEKGRFKGGEYEFKSYEGEEKDASYYLVDADSGRVFSGVSENQVIYEPELVKDKDGNVQYLLDDEGRPVYDDVIQEDLKIRFGSWDKVPEEEKKEAQIKMFKKDEQGNIQTKEVHFKDFKEKRLKNGKSMGEIQREFFKQQVYAQIQQQLGQARQFELHHTEGLEKRKKYIEELQYYKRLKKSLLDQGKRGEQEWEKQKALFSAKVGNGQVPDQIIDPVDELQKAVDQTQREILYGRETSIGGRTAARNALRQINNAKPIEEYALEKSKKTASELGIYAMKQTEAMKRARPKDKVKPIFITLENVYPQEYGYGSHPRELLNLVKIGREQMTKDLVKEHGLSKSEAQKKAEQHIKATIDTGHMNMWRKHFVAKPNETKDQTDARYKKWYLQEMEHLAKSGIIGNVHLADNFGYDDTHLAYGQGNVPAKEVLKILKKHGYDEKMIVEGGFNQGKVGHFEGWRVAGSSMYSHGQVGTQKWLDPSSRWTQSYDGYLGVGAKPNFIFKGYAPDNEDWQPWSETGME